MVQNTSFAETQVVLRALDFALAKGGFGGNASQKKTAVALVKKLKSNRSVGGRHLKLVGMIKKGATIDEMIKVAGSSRRTVFRYLNHLEEAGFNITLADGKYKITG